MPIVIIAVLVLVIFFVVSGAVAKARGHSFILFGLLGLVTSPVLAIILALIIAPPATAGTARRRRVARSTPATRGTARVVVARGGMARTAAYGTSASSISPSRTVRRRTR